MKPTKKLNYNIKNGSLKYPARMVRKHKKQYALFNRSLKNDKFETEKVALFNIFFFNLPNKPKNSSNLKSN